MNHLLTSTHYNFPASLLPEASCALIIASSRGQSRTNPSSGKAHKHCLLALIQFTLHTHQAICICLNTSPCFMAPWQVNVSVTHYGPTAFESPGTLLDMQKLSPHFSYWIRICIMISQVIYLHIKVWEAMIWTLHSSSKFSLSLWSFTLSRVHLALFPSPFLCLSLGRLIHSLLSRKFLSYLCPSHPLIIIYACFLLLHFDFLWFTFDSSALNSLPGTE